MIPSCTTPAGTPTTAAGGTAPAPTCGFRVDPAVSLKSLDPAVGTPHNLTAAVALEHQVETGSAASSTGTTATGTVCDTVVTIPSDAECAVVTDSVVPYKPRRAHRAKLTPAEQDAAVAAYLHRDLAAETHTFQSRRPPPIPTIQVAQPTCRPPGLRRAGMPALLW